MRKRCVVGVGVSPPWAEARDDGRGRRASRSVFGAALLSVAALAVTVCWGAILPPLASAEPGPGWEITGRSLPTNFSSTPAVSPQVSGTIELDVFNVGAGPAACTASQRAAENSEGVAAPICPDGSPQTNVVTVTDVLPPGLRAVAAGELGAEHGALAAAEPIIGHSSWECTGNGPGGAPRVVGATVVTCKNKTEKLTEEERDLGVFPGGGGSPTLNIPPPAVAHPLPIIGISVDVQPGASEQEANRATIAGGGAPTAASTSSPVTINSQDPAFGVVGWDGWFSNVDGTLDTQAGSHPYEATFSFDLASALLSSKLKQRVTGGEVKTAEIDLPPGFVGDPTAVPQCPRSQFDSETCPQASIIGTVTAYFANVPPNGLRVFNLVPPPGVPAEFGFSLQALNTYLDARVRSGKDYGITENVTDIAHKEVVQAITTIWGDPGDPSHDLWRNGETGGCPAKRLETTGNPCSPTREPVLKPFLTLPTACGEPQPFVIRATSWTGLRTESTFYTHDAGGAPTGFKGCENLAFGPAIVVSPGSSNADTPTGLSVEVSPPLGGLQALEGLGSADIQATTVTLPPGFVVNPGQAEGLQACQPGEDGLTTEAERALGEENSRAPSCPPASRIGTVTATTPLLEGAAEKELSGNVYVMQSNPPHVKLLAALSGDGVNVKLVLDAELDSATGQITTRVVNVPQFPVSHFKLALDGGSQAALDTPTSCGTYQTSADFTPWSSPFGANFSANATFGITSGPGGSGCAPSPLPFAPSLTAGSTTEVAGAFTGFSLLLQRGDGQQRIDKLQVLLPEGLAGMISNVPQCPEPQASLGTCSSSSQIGHATAAAGPGGNPLVIPQPGKPESPIFLTGPYEGAPFGLAIVTHVIAGPFDLGTIITRAKIEVDPHTAQVTVTTDPLPQIVAGVPTDLRWVTAQIDRPDFIFNPTHCDAAAVVGSAQGSAPPGVDQAGSTTGIETRFQTGACQSLKFAPRFSVTTPAKTSKATGAGLSVRLAYPAAPQGTQSEIRKVKVELPKQLPSQLKTLQKACTATIFESNPAACPPHSIVGHATVHTPVLPMPLSGPVYFVSHGNEAFPSLTMILQGDGVTVQLVGATLIKNGVTSTMFRTVPDVPFSTFELVLPQGEYAALAANLPAKAKGNLCGQGLVMPTEFVAQNGLEIHQRTPIAVSGCPKTKIKTRAQRLAAALKLCKKKSSSARRAACRARANRKYGIVRRKAKKQTGGGR